MSATKSLYHDLTSYSIPNNPSAHADRITERITKLHQDMMDLIRAQAKPPKSIFILTMHGKPLSVYANEDTAQFDLRTLNESEELFPASKEIFRVVEMRVDYTTPAVQKSN
jgi:hypothetical protein